MSTENKHYRDDDDEEDDEDDRAMAYLFSYEGLPVPERVMTLGVSSVETVGKKPAKVMVYFPFTESRRYRVEQCQVGARMAGVFLNAIAEQDYAVLADADALMVFSFVARVRDEASKFALQIRLFILDQESVKNYERMDGVNISASGVVVRPDKEGVFVLDELRIESVPKTDETVMTALITMGRRLLTQVESYGPSQDV